MRFFIKHRVLIIPILLGVCALVFAIIVHINMSPNGVDNNLADKIYNFLGDWALILGAAGTIIFAISVFLFIYENRRREEREKEQAIHALHNEIHWNLRPIITLRYDISNWLKRFEENRIAPPVTEALYRPIETRVFDDMRSQGQLHWLEELRMDVVFCYGLIDTYNLDKSFEHKHLELLTTLHDRLDKTIRALEAKFEFLPRYMKYEDSENTVEHENSQEDTSQAYNASHDELRKEYFLALAPAFLIGSYYLIQASSKNTELHLLWFTYKLPHEISIGLSVFLLLWAVFMCYLVFGRIPQSSKGKVYGYAAGFGSITLIFYMYEWIRNLVEIIKSDIGLWYFYLFYSIGLIVIGAMIVYPFVISVVWLRKRIKAS